jgi:hypothetical protein
MQQRCLYRNHSILVTEGHRFPLLFVHYAYSFYILVDAPEVPRTNRPYRVLAGWNFARHRHVPQIEPPRRGLTGTERVNESGFTIQVPYLVSCKVILSQEEDT